MLVAPRHLFDRCWFVSCLCVGQELAESSDQANGYWLFLVVTSLDCCTLPTSEMASVAMQLHHFAGCGHVYAGSGRLVRLKLVLLRLLGRQRGSPLPRVPWLRASRVPVPLAPG